MHSGSAFALVRELLSLVRSRCIAAAARRCSRQTTLPALNGESRLLVSDRPIAFSPEVVIGRVIYWEKRASYMLGLASRQTVGE